LNNKVGATSHIPSLSTLYLPASRKSSPFPFQLVLRVIGAWSIRKFLSVLPRPVYACVSELCGAALREQRFKANCSGCEPELSFQAYNIRGKRKELDLIERGRKAPLRAQAKHLALDGGQTGWGVGIAITLISNFSSRPKRVFIQERKTVSRQSVIGAVGREVLPRCDDPCGGGVLAA
jgi:hypothetical protein